MNSISLPYNTSIIYILLQRFHGSIPDYLPIGNIGWFSQ